MEWKVQSVGMRQPKGARLASGSWNLPAMLLFSGQMEEAVGDPATISPTPFS